MDLEQAITLWFHYETIAMHFNELIIQYRLQLMAGIGAIGAISGYLVGSKVTEESDRHKLRAFISLGLLIILVAAAYLDLFYYNELLRGEVDALLELECQYPELNMSSSIKARFPDGATTHIFISYGLVIIHLLLFTIWAFCTLNTGNNDKNV